MSLALKERSPTALTTPNKEALAIIDHYRQEMDEHFRVEPLDTEFPTFAEALGHQGLLLARAGDNTAGAFKWRGALVGAHYLHEQGASSLLVPSAGNHLRGAVLAAKALDIPLCGVVPRSAPDTKKQRAKELWPGGKVILREVGDSFDESLTWALSHPELGELLHPYDDPNVIAGQGTLADDIVAATGGNVDHIVMPVGGGGLLAGIRNRLDLLGKGDTLVHAVEPPGSDSFSKSLASDQLRSARHPNRNYGGSAVRRIGQHAFAACRDAKTVQTHSVSNEEVALLADSYHYDRQTLLRSDTPAYEPTTLVAIAGLKRVARQYPNETIVVIGTGHNDTPWPKSRSVRGPLNIF